MHRLTAAGLRGTDAIRKAIVISGEFALWVRNYLMMNNTGGFTDVVPPK
jgi:hypothetical protein